MAVYAVIAIAVVLVLPSLFSGFFIDEYIQAVRWKAVLDTQQGIVDFLNRVVRARTSTASIPTLQAPSMHKSQCRPVELLSLFAKSVSYV